MATTAYVTSAEIKADPATVNLGTSFDAVIPQLILRASELIDRLTRREPGAYDASATASDRYFDAHGERDLYIDECVEVSAVYCRFGSGTDWTTLASTDYVTWPYNASAQSHPITRLDIDRRQGTYETWPSTGPQSVKVTAKWGYSASPPYVVKQAVIIQSIRWLRRAQQLYADAGMSAAGTLTYAQRLDPDVETLIKDSGLMRKAGLF